ncbi:8-oxo-dGTP diphosphatase [Candidatus Nomurabacteria bacterium]|nr:8-oxo-dGTP diphosphatase [Candidatus Nomurabacteria bacterium]
MKKRRFGVGKWNGYGGKVMEGETIEEALVREVKEEAEIVIKNPEKIGILEFEFIESGLKIENHIYKVTEFSGEPVETEEMRPEWFNVDEIPFKDMWPDDVYWMPLFLKNKKFKGRFVFGESDVILEKELEEVKNL